MKTEGAIGQFLGDRRPETTCYYREDQSKQTQTMRSENNILL